MSEHDKDCDRTDSESSILKEKILIVEKEEAAHG